MKDWEERLEALGPRLAEWYRRFDEELARALKRRRGLFRRPRAADFEAAEIEARGAVGEDAPGEAAEITTGMAVRFLEALPGERARMRARAGSDEAYFRFLTSYLASMPAWVEDETTLRLALAVFSIHDLRGELERVERLLAELWIAADESGLDPAPAWGEVALLANPATGGGSPRFREHLEGFERSRTFRELVAPRLAARRRARAS